MVSPPKVPSGPLRRQVLASIVGIAGLAMAVIGGWRFLSTDIDAACPHQGAAACLQGYVLFTDAQLLGGAIALAGIALVFTALVLALRP